MGDVPNINWMAIPHEQLYKEIHSGPGTSAGESARAFYDKLRKNYDDARSDLADGLRNLGAAWEGLAADSAQASIGRFGPWSDLASSSARSGGTSTEMQSWHWAHAKNKMPEPKPAMPMPDNNAIRNLKNFFTLGVDRQVQEAIANEAHIRAAEVMRTYATSSQGMVSSFPAFAPPPQIGIEVPGAPAPPPTPPIGGTPPIRGPRGSQGGDGGFPVTRQDGTSTDPRQQESSQGDPDRRDEERRGRVEQQNFQPLSTNPAPTPSPLPTPRDGGGYSGAGAFGAGFGIGGGGASGRSAGGGGITSPSPGGGAGGGATGRGGPGSQSAPASARNVAGRPGQSFMQPALAQSQQEEDSEHVRKYSVTDDLVGELPKVAPPVIGE